MTIQWMSITFQGQEAGLAHPEFHWQIDPLPPWFRRLWFSHYCHSPTGQTYSGVHPEEVSSVHC